MTNKNYIKGSNYERKIVNYHRNNGCIAFRSAGSHSPIDVVIIDPKKQIIKFIQCKTGKSALTQKEKADKELNYLRVPYQVFFEVQ